MGAELSPAETSRLAVREVSKTFGRARALSGVSLDVRPGELHGLVGQNGSGKSTLVKVLTGVHAPDPGGEVLIDGQPLRLPVRPLEARARGVSVVHQSLGLIDGHSVVENMRVGRFQAGALTRRIRWRDERAHAAAVLRRLGAEVDLDADVGRLSEQERATVAIARAMQDLGADGGLIVFDESTRALTRDALAHFYEQVGRATADGAAVLLISHRLEEVLDHADRVTVLRDGAVVAAGRPTGDLSEAALTQAMLGYELEALPHGRAGARASVVATARLRDGVELTVAEGEVVGVTGVVGSGYEDVPYALAGARPAPGGELRLDGERFDLGRPCGPALLDRGVALVPERREQEGLALELTVAENLTLPRVARRARPWWTGRRWQREETQAMIDRLGIRPPRPDAPAGTLSGGNQQKVQLGKWLAGAPRLLLVHEPTHAVDVGARHDIVLAIHDAAEEGCGVVVASSDPQELAVLCDRVLVFAEGRVVTELAGRPDAARIVAATFADRAA